MIKPLIKYMKVISESTDFHRYLTIQSWAFCITIVTGIGVSFLKNSNWYIIILPLASIPLSLVMFYAFRIMSEGSVNLFYGMGRTRSYSSKGGLLDADMWQAHAMRREGRFQEVVELYEEISQKAPDRPEPLFEMAEVYRILEDWNRARAAYTKVVVLFRETLGSDHFYIYEARRRGKEMLAKVSGKEAEDKRNCGDGESSPEVN